MRGQSHHRHARTHTTEQQGSRAGGTGTGSTNQWAQVEVATAAAGSEPASAAAAAAAMAFVAGPDGRTDRAFSCVALALSVPDRAGERCRGPAGMARSGAEGETGGWVAGGFEEEGEFGGKEESWRREETPRGGCVIREFMTGGRDRVWSLSVWRWRMKPGKRTRAGSSVARDVCL